MHKWLQDFPEAFRIDMGVYTFVLAGGGVILIAALTISFQALKAAFANPIDSLKSE